MLFYTKEIITLKHNRITSCETLCSHSMGGGLRDREGGEVDKDNNDFQVLSSKTLTHTTQTHPPH